MLCAGLWGEGSFCSWWGGPLVCWHRWMSTLGSGALTASPPSKKKSFSIGLFASCSEKKSLSGRQEGGCTALSKPCETLHSPFMYISLYSPSCLGFLYCQWVQGGGTGAKEARSRVKQILCACWAAVQLSVTLNSSELVCAAMNDIIAA